MERLSYRLQAGCAVAPLEGHRIQGCREHPTHGWLLALLSPLASHRRPRVPLAATHAHIAAPRVCVFGPFALRTFGRSGMSLNPPVIRVIADSSDQL